MMRNIGRGTPNNIYNNNQKLEKRNLTLARINEERFAYAMSCLVGKDVIVGMDNGRLMKGSFHSFDPSSRTNSKAVDIALQNARFVSSEKDEGHAGRPFVIYGHEYNYVVAHSPKMGGGNRASKTHPPSERPAPSLREPTTTTTTTTKRPSVPKFKTDTEISASKSGRQNDKLTEWKPDGPVDESQLYELEAKGNTQWDQFESNRKAFGVKSTYNENLYTTELKLDEVPREMKERASKLAAEIMGRDGESGYSHLEHYLEQDEDNMYNPTAEIVVKKALAKSMKASKRDEKHEPAVKTKSRQSDGGGGATTAHNQRPSTANHSMSNKEVPDTGRGHTSTPSVKQSADPTTRDWRSQGVGGPATERDRSHHQQSQGGKSSNAEAAAAATPIPPVGRPEVQAVPSKSEAHASTPTTGESKKGERGVSLAPPQKGEDKSSPRFAGGDVKPIAPSPVVSSTATKKSSFTFNPNASTFTPTSVVDPGAKAATGVQSGPTGSAAVAKVAGSTPQKAAAPKASGAALKGADSSDKPATTVATTTTSNEVLEFKAFTPMDEYPRLDVSSYTAGAWLVHEQDFDVKWPNCSKSSYRAIIGDVALLQLTQTMAGLRPQQPILPTPGMATVIIPHNGSVAYPGYQFGGIPLNMLPYNRQVTPKYYNSPKQKHPPVQAQYAAARRSAAIGSQPQLQTVGTVQVAISGKSKTPSESKPDAQT